MVTGVKVEKEAEIVFLDLDECSVVGDHINFDSAEVREGDAEDDMCEMVMRPRA